MNQAGPEWWGEGEQWKSQNPEPSFVPGDKVVCVNAELTHELAGARSWGNRRGGGGLIAYPTLPESRKLYVIREVSGPFVFLVGITAGLAGKAEEMGFAASRFILLSEYRAVQARLRKHSWWAKMKEMEAFEKEASLYNRDGSLNARGRKRKGSGQE